eukprot:scaffold117031_cov37-Tisochrysis_lutea.AAC.5
MLRGWISRGLIRLRHSKSLVSISAALGTDQSCTWRKRWYASASSTSPPMRYGGGGVTRSRSASMRSRRSSELRSSQGWARRLSTTELRRVQSRSGTSRATREASAHDTVRRAASSSRRGASRCLSRAAAPPR